jgi:hypothetical protein
LFSSTLAVSGVNAVTSIGNNTQIVDDITISAAAVRFEAGPAWNFDGVINITSGGDQCKMTLGALGNLALTFTCAGAETEMHLGANCQIVGNILIDGIRSIWRQGSIADINGTVLLTGAGTEMHLGMAADLAQTLGITTGTGGQSFSCGSNSTITGIITMSSVSARLRIGNDSNVVAAVNLSGVDGYIYAEQKANFGGIVTISGTGCSFIMENGCDLDGIILSGSYCTIDGGGWDTFVDGSTANMAINMATGDYNTVKNIRVQTTSGASGSGTVVIDTPAGSNYHTFMNIWFSGADNVGLSIAAIHATIIGCYFSGTFDNAPVSITGAGGNGKGMVFVGNHMNATTPAAAGINITVGEAVVVGNWFGSSLGGDSIYIGADGDNSLVVGNIFTDTGNPISVNVNGEDTQLSANLMNAAVNEGSGTAEVTGLNKVY